jgi:hypothetical protein
MKRVSLRTLLLINTTALAAVTLASCPRIVGAGIAALFAAAASLAVVLDAFRVKRPPRLLMGAASLAVLVSAFARVRYETVFIVFTEAVLMMLAVKTLEEKRSRDYFQIAALSVFTLICAAAETSDGSFVYYCAAVSVLAGHELLLAAWFARSPDYALSAKEVLQTSGRTAAIWLMALPLCLALFFAAPRAGERLGYLARGAPRDSRTGLPDRITLGALKNIQEDESPAFRAEMPLVAPKYLFWRGLALDVFDGRTWEAGARERGGAVVPDARETVRQEISLESGYMDRLFALDIPIFIDAPGAARTGDGAFINTNYRRRLHSYAAVSSLSDVLKPAGLRPRFERYLRLPDGYAPRLRELALRVTAGASPEGRAAAVLSFLSGEDFSYSLDDLPVSDNALEDFVLSRKKGNCEYFASAMAVMLRFAGVPSRLVAGYHGGVYNENGGFYTVSQSNAHVWVEVWDDGAGGWRRYDPTPPSFEAGGESGAGSRFGFLRTYLEFFNYRATRIFMEYGIDTQSRIIESLRDALANPSASLGFALENFSFSIFSLTRGKIFVAAIFSIAVLSAAAWKFFPRGWRKKSREEILRRDFLAAMKKLGYEKKLSEGLEEFVRSLRGRAPDAVVSAASGFVEMFERFYFKDIPADDAAKVRLGETIRELTRLGREIKTRKL